VLSRYKYGSIVSQHPPCKISSHQMYVCPPYFWFNKKRMSVKRREDPPKDPRWLDSTYPLVNEVVSGVNSRRYPQLTMFNVIRSCGVVAFYTVQIFYDMDWSFCNGVSRFRRLTQPYSVNNWVWTEKVWMIRAKLIRRNLEKTRTPREFDDQARRKGPTRNENWGLSNPFWKDLRLPECKLPRKIDDPPRRARTENDIARGLRLTKTTGRRNSKHRARGTFNHAVDAYPLPEGQPRYQRGKGVFSEGDHGMDKGGSTSTTNFEKQLWKGTQDWSAELKVGRNVAYFKWTVFVVAI
jgi:hypothetical protein